MVPHQPFKLPDGLELGVATAATQIEGGDRNNSWYEWSTQPGRIAGSSTTLRANDHWNRTAEDIALMAGMGIRHYRMGLEWSRIEPEQGRFDGAAIDHYRQELRLLRENGIEPLVTLHHFSNPLWFQRLGSFEKPGNRPLFLHYVAHVAEQLQDLCSQYITINEPNVYAVLGYHFGIWPPGARSLCMAIRVMRNLALCHIEAYRLIHRIYGERPVKVGTAINMRVLEPVSPSLANKAGAAIMSWIFQGAVVKAALTGRFLLPVGIGAPLGRGRFYDFIGLNYYSRSGVKGLAQVSMPGAKTNKLGWEYYPQGIDQFCRKLYDTYQAPVWITENGTCETDDRQRIDYLYAHLRAIAECPVPVERYYHWTFIDNFEWAEGEQAPFGLVALDFETQARTVRGSGHFYSEIIRSRGVTPDIAGTWLTTAAD